MNRRHLSKTLAVLAAAAAVSGLLPAHAATEGTDYVVLDKPIPNAQGTLIKVFSYLRPPVTLERKSGRAC